METRKTRFVPLLLLLAGCSGLNPGKVNLLPMYGGKPKSPEMVKIDEEFKQAILKRGMSLDSGSKEMARLGWSYLSRGDRKTAMKRFNQCWLLDSGNYECYWGFGSLAYQGQEIDEAIKYYKMGSERNSQSIRFNMDIVSAFVQKYLSSGKKDVASAAVADSILGAQDSIDPLDQKYLCLGAGAKHQLGKNEEACVMASKCTDKIYADAVSFKCDLGAEAIGMAAIREKM